VSPPFKELAVKTLVKILLKIVGGILVFCLLVLLVVRITGFNPGIATSDHPTRWETHPGLWLTGHVVSTPVTDWSFSDQIYRVQIQTRTRYLLPHSVTVTCTAVDGKLYLTSAMQKGVEYPNGAAWHRDLARDPRFLIKMGDNLYPVKMAYHVTDLVEDAAVDAAKIKKYPPYGHSIGVNVKPRPGAYEMAVRVVSLSQ
jgi:hypothetical protein